MYKFAKKSFSLASNIATRFGYQISLKKISENIGIYHQDYSEDSIINRRFYNVGAGGHVPDCHIKHPYWTNLEPEDTSTKSNGKKNLGDIVLYDMLMKDTLPIQDNSAEIILSQYSIEHVTNDAADYFFKESHRVLKNKGLLRVVTPNIELDFRAYKNNDRSHFWWEALMSKIPEQYGHAKPLNQTSLEQLFISHFATNASTIHIADNPDKIEDIEFQNIMKSAKAEEIFDYCTSHCKVDIQKEFRINHINWWNHNKLIKAIKNAGFKEVYIVAPNQSSARVLRNKSYFDRLWNEVALFVEAVK